MGVLSFGYGADGRRRRKIVYATTKTAVLDKMKGLANQASSATLAESNKMTVAQYLNHWFSTTHKPSVEPATSDRNEILIRKHLAPLLASVRLVKLSVEQARQLLADLVETGNSLSCCRRCVKLLRTILKQAVKDKLIPSNPALDVTLPKATKKDIQPFNSPQVTRFLKFAAEDRLSTYYVLALDTGMRSGELNGLQWPDIDFDCGSIQVQRSLEERKGKHRLKETKTKSGRRRIDLSKFAIEALHDHRKKMFAEGHLDSQVFCDGEGGYIRKSNLQRYSFKKIIGRANDAAKEEAEKMSQKEGRPVKPVLLPSVRLHDLRHTCATLLLMNNVNPKIVSERLGHSSIELTLNTYSHVLPTMQAKAALAMDAVFAKAAQ
jgi:integrase